jgi:hypothetical protein
MQRDRLWASRKRLLSITMNRNLQIEEIAVGKFSDSIENINMNDTILVDISSTSLTYPCYSHVLYISNQNHPTTVPPVPKIKLLRNFTVTASLLQASS